MRSLTIPCVAAFLGSLVFAGAGRADSTSIGDLFRVVAETETVLESTAIDLAGLEMRTAHVADSVEDLSIAFRAGADPEEIRFALDSAFGRTAALQSRLDACRSQLRECDRVLTRAAIEARRLEMRGHALAPELLLAIRSCFAKMQPLNTRSVECDRDLGQIRVAIERLYAMLPLPG